MSFATGKTLWVMTWATSCVKKSPTSPKNESTWAPPSSPPRVMASAGSTVLPMRSARAGSTRPERTKAASSADIVSAHFAEASHQIRGNCGRCPWVIPSGAWRTTIPASKLIARNSHGRSADRLGGRARLGPADAARSGTACRRAVRCSGLARHWPARAADIHRQARASVWPLPCRATGPPSGGSALLPRDRMPGRS